MYLTEKQAELYRLISKNRIVLAEGGARCFGEHTEILMFDGSIKFVEDIQAGDVVMGWDNTPRRVLNINTGHGELYRISSNSGHHSFICNEDHVLTVKLTWKPFKGIIRRGWQKGDIFDIPLYEFQKLPVKAKTRALTMFTVPVDFPHKGVDIPPYILGLWLGDGSSGGPCFTFGDTKKICVEVLFEYAKTIDAYIRVREDIGKCPMYHVVGNTNKQGDNGLINGLRKYNLLSNKHIPAEYLYNSREMRLNLLAGLLDTDGHYSVSKHYDIIQKNEGLAKDIVFLARSLGFKAIMSPCQKSIKSIGFTGTYYRIYINGDNIDEIPCRIAKKVADKKTLKSPIHNFSFSVTPIGIGNYYGFTIEGDGRFLLGDFTVVHNSGKTAGFVNNIFLRAVKYPNTDYLIVRHRFNHVKLSIGMQTIPQLEQINKVPYSRWLNHSDMVFQVPNGSRVWLDGLDDKQRAEKALGREYALIYFNEASEIGYNEFELLQTRLNPPKGVNPHIFIDYNPPSITHWGYQIFRKRKFPDGSNVPEGDYAYIKMNPADNPHLSDSFIKTLEGLSAAKRKRFLEGEYATDSGALWKRAWIKYGTAERYERIVVAVDPTGSVQGDECGIIVSGRSGGNYYTLEDYSLHGTPKEWATEVCAAYDRWRADVVVAEKNFGGDMVAETIRHVKPNINVKLVWSSRGKLVRAEPISALYEQGKVFHAKRLPELEDECCVYSGEGDSPNRLDALVFGLSELSEGRGGGVSFAEIMGV